MDLKLRVQALMGELQLADGILDRDRDRGDLVQLEAVGDSLQFTSRGKFLWLQTSCPAEVSSGGSIAIPTRRLLAYLKLLPAEQELKIATSEDSDSSSVEITLVRAKTKLPGLTDESFDIKLESSPAAEGSEAVTLPEPSVKLPADVLLEALKRTIISVADEQAHYAIEGAQLIIQHDKLGMVSTDGHRLSLYLRDSKLDGVTDEINCLLGRKAMTELIHMLEQSEGTDDEPPEIEFAQDETQIYFRAPRRFLVSQKLAGRFPEYQRVMPSKFNASLDLEHEKLAPVLRRVSLFSERRSHGVRFDIADGKIKMQAQVFGDDSDMLRSEESVEIDYAGDPIRVGFNVRYILDFLQICGSDKFRLHVGDPRSAALMEVPDPEPGTDYRYVLMPIRV